MFSKPQGPNPSANVSEQTHIALWGPSGAGKDWLFRAFNKELAYYNQQDQDFHYEVCELQPGEPNPIPLSAEPPINIPPTAVFDDIHYLFRRMALKQDTAHQVSAQAHDIIIHNEKGANLVDSLNDQVTFESTFKTLIGAHNILLVLGIPKDEKVVSIPQPTHLPLPEQDSFGKVIDDGANGLSANAGDLYSINSLEALRSDWSREDYLKFMQLLLAALAQTPGSNLAVCMTKSDQLNFRGDPRQVLQRRYGEAMHRLLEVHGQKHTIEAFVTSAAGYLKQGGKVMPNFESGALRNPGRWNPVNTAAPFFWVFEKIERERLHRGSVFFRNGNQKSYIPYPTPRQF